MPTLGFVLVHGGYHGAWCWEDLVPLLDLPAVAVDLPGRGVRPGGGTPVTIDRCVDAVLSDAGAAGLDRFVLVGHSMGGLTLSGTARRAPERLAHVVYVAALVPAEGTNVFDVFFGPDGGGRPELAPDGTMPVLPDELSRPLFMGDLDDERFARAAARLVPEAAGLFLDPAPGPPDDIPTTYVRCSRDGAVTAAMADGFVVRLGPVSDVVAIDSDHDVMLSHPDLLADVLNRVALEISTA